MVRWVGFIVLLRALVGTKEQNLVPDQWTACGKPNGSIMSQGATSTDNNFQMNGLTINDVQGSWIYSSGIPAPSPDGIQEFKVQTALFH